LGPRDIGISQISIFSRKVQTVNVGANAVPINLGMYSRAAKAGGAGKDTFRLFVPRAHPGTRFPDAELPFCLIRQNTVL
jgi:hypothetical protein